VKSARIIQNQASAMTDARVSLSGIVHDLNAPLNNIRGFSHEISDALASLPALLEAHSSELPEAFQQSVAKLINQDLSPCLNCRMTSVALLSARIDSHLPADTPYNEPVQPDQS